MLPPFPEGGSYKVQYPGSKNLVSLSPDANVPDRSLIYFKCTTNYKLNSNIPYSVCIEGEFKDVPKCVGE